MQIVIKQKVSCGLEVFECHVNGTLATQFLSIAAARTWSQKFLARNSQK